MMDIHIPAISTEYLESNSWAVFHLVAWASNPWSCYVTLSFRCGS